MRVHIYSALITGGLLLNTLGVYHGTPYQTKLQLCCFQRRKNTVELVKTLK
ncbi:MAG: hypothetical protein ACLSCV_10655 [Acutalibacteraceae bacterium]